MFACLQLYASSGQSEVPNFFEGARSRDLVDPLTEEEIQRFSWWSWLKWSLSSAHLHVIAFASTLRGSIIKLCWRMQAEAWCSSALCSILLPPMVLLWLPPCALNKQCQLSSRG
jgi:hypothetical protein